MQRFVYSPKVEVYVKLDDAQRGFKTVSLTDDVIGGSVTRRLNAVSEMSLTLQNKYGKYTETNQIRPMDRIIVRSRPQLFDDLLRQYWWWLAIQSTERQSLYPVRNNR
jgi:hypothetical protein